MILYVFQNVTRLRIGIDRPEGKEVAVYVLQRFTSNEREATEKQLTSMFVTLFRHIETKMNLLPHQLSRYLANNTFPSMES